GLRAVGAAAGGPRRSESHEALAAAARAAVHHLDPLPALSLVDQSLARLASRLAGARDPRGDVDRDDLPAVAEERLVDLHEVADRGLRGGGAFLAVPEALEELAVGLAGDLALPPLFAFEGHVEAHTLDAVLGDNLVREVRGGVGDDVRAGHRGGFYTTPHRAASADRAALRSRCGEDPGHRWG